MPTEKDNIETEGGAYIGRDVSPIGDFVGRDKNVIFQFFLGKFRLPILLGIIALTAVIVTVIAFVIANLTTPLHSFDYQVRVETKAGNPIPNATVTLEIGGGKAPLDSISDSTGLARIFIEMSYVGKPGRVIAEASGYKKYMQNIDLTDSDLPKIIQLHQIP